MTSSIVALSSTTNTYLNAAPYHPSDAYPEYPFPAKKCISTSHNGAYAAVRRSLELLGLDRAHQGSPEWNPLRDIVHPGASVVVKPNWVYHSLPGDPHPEEVLVTHPSVIRAVLDYVFLACGPSGRITLGDAPIQGADFEQILDMSHINDLLQLFQQYHNFNIELVDFRNTVAAVTPGGRVVQQKQERSDPKGYRIVDLSEKSFLEEVGQYWRQFRIFDYDPTNLHKNHYLGTHKYLVSGSVLDADVIVNIPKLKTHGKCGVTGSLKNLVGINGDKAYLPHFRTGSPGENGDDYPFPSALKHARTEVRSRLVLSDNEVVWRSARWLGRRALGLARHIRPRPAFGGTNPYDIFSGHWFGNDTAWRMVLDLNLLLFYGNSAGQIKKNCQRRYISIIDAIVAGEGNGPLRPIRRPVGAILAGTSPVATDLVASHIMGFDWQKIPLLRAARTRLGSCFPDPETAPITVCSDAGQETLESLAVNWHFRPPDGWIGYIERQNKRKVASNTHTWLEG
jgi:uncharacterized protein (DUF362 family)